MKKAGPIGFFDSGYGGLTVLKEVISELPEYDYIYLGDNARAPYGSRSFETVYQYTHQCVYKLFEMGCRLVIVACNTASARALRSIQQKDLPLLKEDHKVLGVIRPTTEIVSQFSTSKKIGILGTAGTVKSDSYRIEIEKFSPESTVHQLACPMWVPLIENNEHLNEAADYFVKKYLDALMAKDPEIDTVVLACTHYPLLLPQIKKHLGENITVLAQGQIVAQSLKDYLQRHPEIGALCTNGNSRKFLTTDDPETFEKQASIFFGENIQASHISI